MPTSSEGVVLSEDLRSLYLSVARRYDPDIANEENLRAFMGDVARVMEGNSLDPLLAPAVIEQLLRL